MIETREGYVIEANGAATAPWRGDVFAFSRGQQTPAERWIIAARPQHEGFFTYVFIFFFSFENVLLMVFVSVFVICYLLLTPRRSI